MSKRVDRSELGPSFQLGIAEPQSIVDKTLKNEALPQAARKPRGTTQGRQPQTMNYNFAAAGPSSAMEEQGSTATVGQPPAKKSRTNTPWTAAEEQRLKNMRETGNSWAEIAKTFPSRTEGSVKKHWYKDMHYAEFAEDESAALLNAIKEYETNKWKVIGHKVGKPAKACEQYAKEHFGNNKT